MQRKCLRTECMQPKYQDIKRFRLFRFGLRHTICLDCEVDIIGQPKPMKHITLEQHRENERLRADNANIHL